MPSRPRILTALLVVLGIILLGMYFFAVPLDRAWAEGTRYSKTLWDTSSHAEIKRAATKTTSKLTTVLTTTAAKANPTSKPPSTPTSLTTRSPYLPKLGDNAYWALGVVRDKLKAKVSATATALNTVVDELRRMPPFGDSEPVVRAVLAYYPTKLDEADVFKRELKFFILSWVAMRAKQPKRFKTDLIISTPKENFQDLLNLGCTTDQRKDSSQAESCIITNHVPLGRRETVPGEPEDPLLVYERYVYSVLCLAEYEGYEYDVMLRSDMDTFLMPGFAGWILPRRDLIAAGDGGYGSDNAQAHLAYVSNQLGLNLTEGLNDLGSSWYGQARLMVAAAKLSIEVMRWLYTQEFSEFERCCSGILGWPHWHWQVLTLYGGHVALNHIGGQVLKSGSESGFQFDFGSTSENEVSDETIKHVHCWHTEEMFSKFQFAAGNYDNMDITSRQGMTTVLDYVTVIALSSHRLTNEEFIRLVTDKTFALKEKNWKRLTSS